MPWGGEDAKDIRAWLWWPPELEKVMDDIHELQESAEKASDRKMMHLYRTMGSPAHDMFLFHGTPTFTDEEEHVKEKHEPVSNKSTPQESPKSPKQRLTQRKNGPCLHNSPGYMKGFSDRSDTENVTPTDEISE